MKQTKNIRIFKTTITIVFILSILSSCKVDQKKEENNTPNTNIDTVIPVAPNTQEKVTYYPSDTLLYGKHSHIIHFGRNMRRDSSLITDTIVYNINQKETQDFRSLDLQMNLLQGPVKATYITCRPMVTNKAYLDSTWQLVYKPYNKKDNKKIDSTLFDIYGKLIQGSVVYNSWQINSKTKAKAKRDINGNIRDVLIETIDCGTLGARYFYDSEGFLKHYNVRGWEDGYKVTNHMSKATLKSYEMEGISEGEPYRYKRFFTTVDTDEYGNWTIRICKQHYFPGNLYIREGQEHETNQSWNVSEEDAELLEQIAEWQNSFDKEGPISQFAVFEDRPQSVKTWIEIRKIIYY